LLQVRRALNVDWHPASRNFFMSNETHYFAIVCVRCQHASLVPDDSPESSACALCGASSLRVPGATFIRDDLPLFAELERIVDRAKLSTNEAALIAGELESVSLRWEPPELVLHGISPRLDGLRSLYDSKQEYSRLLLVVAMLLTIVCARMIGGATPKPSLRRSNMQSIAANGDATEDRKVG
jgi:hypothetical protein